MTKAKYAEYLRSAHWQNFRKEVMDDSYECQRCEIPRWLAEIAYGQDLNLHHLHYHSLGNEKGEDVEVLCRRCHEIEEFGKSYFRKAESYTCTCCGYLHWDPRSNWCISCERLIVGEGVSTKVLKCGEPAGFERSLAFSLGSYLAKYGRRPEDVVTRMEDAYLRQLELNEVGFES